ncbi:Fc.00g055820.m01.CDS01 [Cosmosporella sp. VM-42]
MPSSMRTFKLNTGAQIPAIGLGTWQSKPGEVRRAVEYAIEIGYRHIDAAYCYDNEDEVGYALNIALASGKVERKDIFVTTKLWCTYHTRVEKNLDLSLKALGLDYVDLYLMHWPVALNPNGNDERFPKHPDGSRDVIRGRSHIDTYKDMETLLVTGKTKAIGVANYSVRYLEELLPEISIIPAVNQIENHPLLPQQEIVDFCGEKGIHVTAYSPLGSSGGPLLQLPTIQRLAKKKGASPSAILLSWHVSSSRSVLAKSVTPSRIEENKNLIDMTESDLEEISQVVESTKKTGGVTRYVYPPFGVDLKFPDKS